MFNVPINISPNILIIVLFHARIHQNHQTALGRCGDQWVNNDSGE